MILTRPHIYFIFLEKEGYGGGAIQPLMISVDPWRDTVKQLREYCQGENKTLSTSVTFLLF
jgi:cytochrome oxidase Cu insertion factor (SCO1/SenC/PrrC family)